MSFLGDKEKERVSGRKNRGMCGKSGDEWGGIEVVLCKRIQGWDLLGKRRFG
jgi:hypothetical protein